MYIFLLFILILFCTTFSKSSREGLASAKRGPTNIMTKVGDGCCRYDGWSDTVKDKGYRSIPECLDLCSSDSNCWAADYKEPKDGKYKCMIYSSIKEPENLHVECDKTIQCYKKEAIPILKSTDEKCPTLKKQTDLIHVVEDEIFVDKSEDQIAILDQIEKGLKELVGLHKRPNPCSDDPNACRPGALNEDEFIDFLKTENNQRIKAAKLILQKASIIPSTLFC